MITKQSIKTGAHNVKDNVNSGGEWTRLAWTYGD